MPAPLQIAILWHMHQPYYRDPLRDEYLLPWTYLHAIKDYFDMAALVEDIPEARVTFNLVPSLLDQIEDYAAGRAVDPFLVRGKMEPADMGEEDRLFILENFFSANRQRMIEPHPRYLELLYLAGDGNREKSKERQRSFRDQDMLDLQVWFFLSWTGEAARRRHPVLQELVRKGKQFTPGDKALLFACHREILGDIIPLYRRLAASGRVELAISPYFHPILPLLCDISSARTAMPRVNLPAAAFRHPEDALRQVREGIACFERIFGFTPAGMWPSEGSVSDEALDVIASCGLAWGASDEGVLARSLPGGLGAGKDALYHPYEYSAGKNSLALLFRDQTLSDLIGFTYSQWDEGRAVADFVGRLQEIRQRVPGSRVAPVILDGENAWEYYPDNGYGFLSSLYRALGTTAGLMPVTFSEAFASNRERHPLHHIHAGSWINASYGIWIGHPEENVAWDLVARARETAVAASPAVAAILAGEAVPPATPETETARLVCRSLAAAEGSDWFWWYGDDHFSPHSDRFDALFRNHLMNIYRLLRLEIPRQLFEPIKQKSVAGFVRDPAALIQPVISGMVTDYFEWLAAGLYDLSRQSSSMHAAESLLHSFFYGYDRKYFYFRIDGARALSTIMTEEDRLSLHLFHGREYRLDMFPAGTDGVVLVKGEQGWEETGITCQWQIDRICELRIPLEALQPEAGDQLFAAITLMHDGEETGRWPADSPMLLKYAGPDIELENWLI
jgi:alpha-amylase/alpha-mannosidase (GH57 family)